jgi:hypothetical protein
MQKLDRNLQPDKRLAAVCGLFCPGCSLLIATHEEPARLAAMATRMGRTVDELQCDGCRSDRRCFYCTSMCRMKTCAAEKGVDFCADCASFPCEVLRTFQKERPHRIELWSSLKQIHERGWEAWFRERTRHYACEQCGVLNSAYHPSCRSCGASPSCSYVRLHGDEVLRFVAR